MLLAPDAQLFSKFDSPSRVDKVEVIKSDKY